MLVVEIDGTYYQLADPISCSRTIIPNSQKLPQAFGLPLFSSSPVELEGFVGDTAMGGSCNVPVYRFCPHNLTHVETPAHLQKTGRDLSTYPAGFFQGVAQLIDLSKEIFEDNYIRPSHLEEHLDDGVDILIVRTPLSALPEETDFTGTDPLSFHPDTLANLVTTHPNLRLLVTDLPSIDRESDGGKLLAHRMFFDFDQFEEGALRAVIELGHFSGVEQGRYYLQAAPAKIASDSMITDLILFRIIV